MLETILLLIFVRPFVSSLAYPGYNLFFTALFIACALFFFLRRKPDKAALSAVALPAAVFFAVLCASALFIAPDRQKGLTELSFYAANLLVLLVSATLAPEKRITFLRILILSATVASCIALYQYAFGFKNIARYIAAHPEYGSDFAADYLSRKRVFAPFVTPNILGGYLAMILVVAVKNKFLPLVILPMAIAFVLTKSLGAFFSLGAGLVIYVLCTGRIKAKHLGICALLVSSLAALYLWRTVASPAHAQPAFSGSMRLAYWTASLKAIAAHPFFGMGLGNFNLEQSRYAHNLILQFWAETGVFGIAAFAWLVSAVLKKATQKMRTAQQGEYVPALIVGAIGVFLIHNLIDFSFFLPEVSLLWWGLMGLLL